MRYALCLHFQCAHVGILKSPCITTYMHSYDMQYEHINCTRKRKNVAVTGPKSRVKKHKNDDTTSNIQTATVCGVGPSTAPTHTDTTELLPPPLHIYTDPSMTAQGSSKSSP